MNKQGFINFGSSSRLSGMNAKEYQSGKAVVYKTKYYQHIFISIKKKTSLYKICSISNYRSTSCRFLIQGTSYFLTTPTDYLRLCFAPDLKIVKLFCLFFTTTHNVSLKSCIQDKLCIKFLNNMYSVLLRSVPYLTEEKYTDISETSGTQES